jgi:ubiquitin-conjugating enzyme E2 O
MCWFAVEGVNFTNHIGNINDPVPIVVKTMVVVESRTTVKILWQDGTIETLPAISIIPYPNIDDLDCW